MERRKKKGGRRGGKKGRRFPLKLPLPYLNSHFSLANGGGGGRGEEEEGGDIR